MEKIAFLGLGHMGAAMARHLLGGDFTLTVWNRTAARTQPFTAAGARAAASAAEAVRDADLVITVLAGPAAVAEVADEIGPELRPGTVWAEMSTVGPDVVRDLAARLPDGVTLVDAPVVGSTDKAEAGTLGILAGGDPDTCTAAEAVLGRFGTVKHTGPLGSAAALKLIVNVSLLGGVALVAEAMALGDALGLDEETVRGTLESGPLSGAAARAFATGVHFDVALGAKDSRLATDVADLPVLRAVQAHYEDAADAADAADARDGGAAGGDIVQVVPFVRRLRE